MAASLFARLSFDYVVGGASLETYSVSILFPRLYHHPIYLF